MAFGIDDAVAAGLRIIDKFIPDPQAKLDAARELNKIVADGRAGQVDLNKAETQNGSILGKWRGFVGWACGISLVYQFIIYPFMIAIVLMVNPKFPVEKIPVLDWKQLGSVLLGMLGLG